jgi:hypothetical protein
MEDVERSVLEVRSDVTFSNLGSRRVGRLIVATRIVPRRYVRRERDRARDAPADASLGDRKVQLQIRLDAGADGGRRALHKEPLQGVAMRKAIGVVAELEMSV